MDKEREIFRVFGGRLKNGFWKEGIELIWGSDFKQTMGCNVSSIYIELDPIKNTVWHDHC